MREQRLIFGNHNDIEEALSEIRMKIFLYRKKIEVHERRQEFRRQNNKFELFRKRFYRSIRDVAPDDNPKVANEQIREFWSTMWNKNPEPSTNSFEKYLCEFASVNEAHTFPSFEEFQQIIQFLPNWKTAGPDGIYNFFIKRLIPIHRFLYEEIREICTQEKIQESWIYKSITYLIPKELRL